MWCGSAADAAPKDDAYHYMKNGVDDQLYNEMWRFNAVDNNTKIMITFLLSDPDNLTSFRKIQVQAVVLQEGQPLLQGSHQSQGYGGDRNSPMFEIDKSGFSSDQSLNPNLKVWGEVLDETTGEPIAWDLVYQPAANPWFSIPLQQHIGHLKGDWMRVAGLHAFRQCNRARSPSATGRIRSQALATTIIIGVASP